MNYSEKQILLAATLAGVSYANVYGIIEKLPEAARQLKTSYETIDDLFNCFCNKYEINPTLLRSKSKHRELVEYRIVFAKLAKVVFPVLSYAKIGKIINRDHSTVCYYSDQVENIIVLRKLYQRIEGEMR